ncbi:hypothetical protein NDU88_001650 [Pleurodeles waltl]|uniref:Uncharacterized protein n=1 Tax=Pleurodeles waltl TaxID=8319 RepID=A0AAV7UWN8_PLEWA|nr:hypothetical protein NDU88_001650 [Pleurodeles waltl]
MCNETRRKRDARPLESPTRHSNQKLSSFFKRSLPAPLVTRPGNKVAKTRMPPAIAIVEHFPKAKNTLQMEDVQRGRKALICHSEQ